MEVGVAVEEGVMYDVIMESDFGDQSKDGGLDVSYTAVSLTVEEAEIARQTDS